MLAALALALGLHAAAAAPHPRVLWNGWRDYERGFIQADGRVIDPKDGGITTSEGQAYALVRAVWVGDRAQVDSLLRWTRDNLQGGKVEQLPAWKWGKRPQEDWGVLDENPASDADLWLAWGLLGAQARWPQGSYAAAAQPLIRGIWEREVLRTGDRYTLLPGPWATERSPIKVNPSYLLPFAFRAFAKVDPSHPWMTLLDDSYALLAEVMAEGRLPADWVFVDPSTGRLAPVPAEEAATQVFGFESMRVPWTLAAEVAWYDETRARALLVPFAGLGVGWRKTAMIPGVMALDGAAAVQWGYTGMYAGLLPAWATARPEDVEALYRRHIEPARNKDGWGEARDYYAQNWTWMSLALWAGLARPPEKL